jgi:hypothetical protein
MRAVVERFEVDDNFASSQIVSSLHLVGSSRLSLIVRRHLVFPYSHRVAISSSHRLIVVASRRIAALFHHTTSLPHDPIIAPSHCTDFPTISRCGFAWIYTRRIFRRAEPPMYF